ncbi:transporter substrate-binding domain-containing protein [uncultured Bradyrhizobium sp.]|uniref:transporter substrate-binding domain-containing protein n=1 Tax=Bradyrhizobium TaxID=374 RepID=UPI00261B65F4|nr:transporter substrate-binding domain-containing protein [uncultured Bradyrhizobium sp.]
MKTTYSVFAVATMALLFAEPSKAQDKVVLAYIEEPPFAATINGQAAGSDVDVAKAVLAKMGVTDVELKKVEFAELLPGVATGRWTMNTALFVTPERCKTVAYSNPIWALVDGMIVRAGNPKHISSYASAAASDARLGVVKGTVQVGTAKAAGVPAERIVEFGAQEEIVAAIKAGRVDAYPNSALGHRALLASLKDADLALAQPFELPVDNGRPKAGFGAFSFNQANGAFVTRFNEELAKFLGSEEHRAIVAKYGLGKEEITPALTAKSEALCK